MTEPHFEVLPGYWPGRAGPFWWENYSAAEVRRDFELASRAGFSSLAVSLIWNDFQPAGQGISAGAMRALERTLSEAADAGLRLEITVLALAIGSLSWLPTWALVPGSQGSRRVFSGHHASSWQSRNLYGDPVLRAAQVRLVREVTGEFGSHPAVSGWVLADGVTAACAPPSAAELMEWLGALVDAAAGPARERGVRCGISTEDLLLSRAVDVGAFRDLELGVRLRTDWQPGWAPDSPRVWTTFLSAYAGRLSGRPPLLAAPFEPGGWAGGSSGAAAETLAAGAIEGGAAGVGVTTLFSLSEGAVRSFPPPDREAWQTGLLDGLGHLGATGQAWAVLAAEHVPLEPIPEAMPEVDPEQRLREPELVARECLTAFLQ